MAEARARPCDRAGRRGRSRSKGQMMTYPVKHVRIADKQYEIAGPNESDAYFNLIHDDFEAHFRLFCRQFVQDDYVCLDIGANIGMKSLMLA
jgi:hypothetical protein